MPPRCAWCRKRQPVVNWRGEMICSACTAVMIRFRRQLNDDRFCLNVLKAFR